MIRINLLPFRLARKKENIRQQISIFFLLIGLTIAGLIYATIWMDRNIQRIENNIKKVDIQIAKYKEKATRVQQIKSDLKKLQDKLDIVASLEAQRDKQLILFDAMTGLVIPGRMWLESFKTTADSVTVKGIAFDNPTIANFMKKLEKYPLFSSVDLKTAQMKKINEDVSLKSFEVMCRKVQPTTQKKGPKG